MNIAVCISGQTRFAQKGFEYFERNFLNKNSADIFIHTWYDTQNEDNNFEYNWNSTNLQKYNWNTVESVYKSYKPKSILIENPKKFFNFVEKTVENNYCSQFYSIEQANQLRLKHSILHKVKYDWVVRMRFDWAWNTPIEFENLDRDILYVVDANSTIPTPNNQHINDQFAISKPENMNVYSSTFENVEKHIKGDRIPDGLEKILYETVKDHMKIEQLPWSHPFPPSSTYACGCPGSLIRY